MRPARGFTLIEMMIALTLFSMMMLAIVAAMRTLGNTQSTLEQVTGRVDEIRGVSEFLRNSLSMAMPVVRLGSPGEAAGAQRRRRHLFCRRFPAGVLGRALRGRRGPRRRLCYASGPGGGQARTALASL